MAFEQSTQRRVLLSLCALKIAAIILAFDPSGSVAFQLPKALASRAFEWLIAAALAVAVISYGVAILRVGRLHLVVLATVVVAALSAVFAADRYVALFGDPENYAGLTHAVDMAVLFLALAASVRQDRDVLLLLGAIVGAGSVAIAYGTAQALGLDPFSWAADPRSRPFATFGNPDHFGHFLSLLFGIALGLLLGLPRARPVAGVVILATAAMAAIVATRGTLLGIAAAVAVASLTRVVTARSAVIVFITALALGAAIILTPLGQRALSGTVADRLELYGIAARAALARPVLGYGTDGFRVAFAANRTAESVPIRGSGPEATAHDWILDAAATMGVAGLAVALVLVIAGTIAIWRLARARPQAGTALFLGWLAYWAHGLVAAYSLAASWYPFVALGVAAALLSPGRDAPRTRAVPVWAVIGIALIALVGAATGARAFQANRDAWSSDDAAHFGDPANALVFADRAAARDPGRADYWDRLGLALDAAGRRDAAVDAYREATARDPYETVYWGNYARAIARIAGNDAARRDAAIAAARQAIAVDPNSPEGHWTLADVAVAFGQCELARSEVTAAVALQPGHSDLVARATNCR